MSARRKWGWWVGVVALAGWNALAAGAEEPTDPLTGLKMAPGWELVRNNCITCHSANQFLQQRGTRQTWKHIIEWMQQRSGLWPLDAATETAILDYLEAHHGPGETFRRPPIPAHLMPQNPYVSPIRQGLEQRLEKTPAEAKPERQP